jgi:hypothetical protein
MSQRWPKRPGRRDAARLDDIGHCRGILALSAKKWKAASTCGFAAKFLNENPYKPRHKIGPGDQKERHR